MTVPCLVLKQKVVVPVSGGVGFMTVTCRDDATGNIFSFSQEADLTNEAATIDGIQFALSEINYAPTNMPDL